MRDPKRSPYTMFETRRQTWMKEGRGQGTGEDYKPWLQTRNVRSSGRKHKIPGILHERNIHVMSDLERNAVLFFETLPNVTDIREQFPLDRDVTRQIAKAIGAAHPADPWTKEDIVMTTDLLIDFTDARGVGRTRPFSVKMSKDLLNHRTVVKQEIERRYWARCGLQWNLLLDDTLRRTEFMNAIMWAREWFYLPVNRTVPVAVWQRRSAIVLEAMASGKYKILSDLVKGAEADGDFGRGEVLSTLRHLIARKRVNYDYGLGTPTLATPTTAFYVIEAARRLAA